MRKELAGLWECQPQIVETGQKIYQKKIDLVLTVVDPQEDKTTDTKLDLVYWAIAFSI